MTRLASYLSPQPMFLLDLACRPIRQAFGTPPYLVGSVVQRPDFRDVDVRLILDDQQYDRIIATPEIRTMLSIAFTAYLQTATGLPIDFGIQRQTQANEQHSIKVRHSHTEPVIGCRCAELTAPERPTRNPLGLRSLADWTGDAPKENP